MKKLPKSRKKTFFDRRKTDRRKNTISDESPANINRRASDRRGLDRRKVNKKVAVERRKVIMEDYDQTFIQQRQDWIKEKYSAD